MDVYAADFETTGNNDYLEDGFTRVYLWAIQNIKSNKILHGDTIVEFVAYLSMLEDKSTVFFHNLAFDGVFIVDHLLKKGWTIGLAPFQFETVISDMNEWFSVTIHFPTTTIYIKDSYKKFANMSLADVARTFQIEGKTSLDVDKRRDVNYIANKEEITRCKRDVEILAYALNETFKQGMDADTTSSDAMQYFMRTLVDNKDIKDRHLQRQIFKRMYPTLLLATTDPEYGLLVKIEQTLRRGYFGGLSYLNPKYENKIIENVSIYDRNSMYPSVMVNYPLPYGRIKKREPGPDDLYVVEIETTFKLKSNHVPFIQNKSSMYRDADVLTESDEPINLVLPSPLHKLFHENYDVEEEIINKWVFASNKGVFDKHINHFMNVKTTTNNPGEKLLSKLRLNSLYGKFGQNHDRVNKVPTLSEDNVVRYIKTDSKNVRPTSYLPVAMFITAYAKYDLIKAAEKFGDRFVYCDTDSVHVIHKDGDDKLLPLDNRKLGYWKYEGTYEIGKYLRSKLYIHGHRDNGINVVDEIKAAGLPESGRSKITFENLDFDREFYGKLVRKSVPGGCVLVPVTYKINKPKKT